MISLKAITLLVFIAVWMDNVVSVPVLQLQQVVPVAAAAPAVPMAADDLEASAQHFGHFGGHGHGHGYGHGHGFGGYGFHHGVFGHGFGHHHHPGFGNYHHGVFPFF